jgi:hypothetical protein
MKASILWARLRPLTYFWELWLRLIRALKRRPQAVNLDTQTNHVGPPGTAGVAITVLSDPDPAVPDWQALVEQHLGEPRRLSPEDQKLLTEVWRGSRASLQQGNLTPALVDAARKGATVWAEVRQSGPTPSSHYLWVRPTPGPTLESPPRPTLRP